MNTQELKECIERHNKKQGAIGADLGFSKAKMTRLLKGADISESDAKLLRLYFYGEVPFGLMLEDKRPWEILEFTEDEWKIISILAKRSGGQSPEGWVVSQIRGFLDNHPLAQEVKNLSREEISMPMRFVTNSQEGGIFPVGRGCAKSVSEIKANTPRP